MNYIRKCVKIVCILSFYLHVCYALTFLCQELHNAHIDWLNRVLLRICNISALWRRSYIYGHLWNCVLIDWLYIGYFPVRVYITHIGTSALLEGYILGDNSLLTGKDLYRAIHALALTWDLPSIIRGTIQLSLLLRHARGTVTYSNLDFKIKFPSPYPQTRRSGARLLWECYISPSIYGSESNSQSEESDFDCAEFKHYCFVVPDQRKFAYVMWERLFSWFYIIRVPNMIMCAIIDIVNFKILEHKKKWNLIYKA